MALAIGFAISSIIGQSFYSEKLRLFLLVPVYRLTVRPAIRLDCIAVHYWNIPKGWNYKPAFQWLYIMGVIYNPIVSFVKLSVLVFIIRFSGVKRFVRRVVWGMGTVNMLTMVAVFIVMMLDCVPFAKNWDVFLPGHCVDSGAFAIATGSINIITDAINIALPFYVFAKLEVSLRRKIGLFLVFSLGIL